MESRLMNSLWFGCKPLVFCHNVVYSSDVSPLFFVTIFVSFGCKPTVFLSQCSFGSHYNILDPFNISNMGAYCVFHTFKYLRLFIFGHYDSQLWCLDFVFKVIVNVYREAFFSFNVDHTCFKDLKDIY